MIWCVLRERSAAGWAVPDLGQEYVCQIYCSVRSRDWSAPLPLLCEKGNEPPDCREIRFSRWLRVILTVELRQIFIFTIGSIGGRNIRVGMCACSTFSLNCLYSRGICHRFAEQPFNGILKATMRSSLFSLNKREFVEYLPLRIPISLLICNFQTYSIACFLFCQCST